MSTATKTLFERGAEILLTGRPIEAVPEVFTEDVRGWSPNFAVESRSALIDVLMDRQDALTNLIFVLDAFDIIEDKVIAEWRFTADHTGVLLVGDQYKFQPTGRNVQLAGSTFAHLRGNKIHSFRNYFDDAALLEQLFLPDDEIKPWVQPRS